MKDQVPGPEKNPAPLGAFGGSQQKASLSRVVGQSLAERLMTCVCVCVYMFRAYYPI